MSPEIDKILQRQQEILAAMTENFKAEMEACPDLRPQLEYYVEVLEKENRRIEDDRSQFDRTSSDNGPESVRVDG